MLGEVHHRSVAKQPPFLVTDWAMLEPVIVVANVFLAAKVSFTDAMADIAEVTGVNVAQLAVAIPGPSCDALRRSRGA